jgi:alcohol dehydrogenase class IV
VLDYLEVIGKGQKITRAAAPWMAIPCTFGTGAEATRNAVIGYPPKHFKASMRSELLLARVALVDPELGVSVPAGVTASSGMDALCQLIEGYTSTGAQPVTDAMALEGIRRASRSLRRACSDGGDVDAREDMALAALLSGMVLANAGLGAVHGLAAPLGARFPIPHGTACAVLLPPVMAANLEALRRTEAAHRALARYAAIGRVLTGDSGLDDSVAVESAVSLIRDLCRDLGIPRLGNFGIQETDFPGIISLAQKSSSMRYNPVRLTNEVLQNILKNAL